MKNKNFMPFMVFVVNFSLAEDNLSRSGVMILKL